MTRATINTSDVSVFLAEQSGLGDYTGLQFKRLEKSEGRPQETPSWSQGNNMDYSGQAAQAFLESTEYGFELTSDYNDDSIELFKKLLHSTKLIVDVTCEINLSNGVMKVDDLSDSAPFKDLNEGDFFYVSGHSNSDMNRAFCIKEKIAGDEIRISGEQFSASTSSCNVYVERHYSNKKQGYDAIQTRTPNSNSGDGYSYKTFVDGVLNTGGLTVPESGVIGTTFSYMFSDRLNSREKVSGQTDKPNHTSPTYTSQKNIFDFFIDGDSARATAEIKSFELTIENNYEADKAAGVEQQLLSKGRFSGGATLVARAYKDDPFRWEDYANNSADVAVAVGVKSASGRAIFKVESGKIQATMTPNGAIENHNIEVIPQGSRAVDSTFSLFLDKE